MVEQKEFMLFVDKKGKVFLNSIEVSMDSLEEKLKEALLQMKDGSLILKADQDVSHGIVVRIMDSVKKSGVKKLVIGTRLTPESKEPDKK